MNLPVAEGRLGRQAGTAWQSSRRCPTGDDDRIRKRRTFTCGGCACFINSVHNRMRCSHVRDPAAGAGSFRGTAVRALLEREPFSKDKTNSRLGSRYVGGRNCNIVPIDTFNYTSKLREPGMRMVAKHARTPRSHSRPHSAPGRLATSVRYSSVERSRGAPGRTLNCPNTVAKCKQEDHSPKEVRRNATHETDALTLAVQ